MTDVNLDPYASGVLNKDEHEMLVKNLPNFCRDAGIQPHWVWTKLSATCDSDVVDYVRRFNHHRASASVQGLLFLRRFDSVKDPAEHMSAIAGALMRNFLKARLMTLHAVLEALNDGDPLEETCLLVPNFCLSTQEAGGKGDRLPGWRISALYDLLVKRGHKGLQTVLYATSKDTVAGEYGTAIGNLLNHYLPVDL